MNHHTQHHQLAEVEFSITARCSLACAMCGFGVPDQPQPQIEAPAAALERALAILGAADIEIDSLALLGGEATLAPALLEDTAKIAAASPVVHRVELVTNGLTPQGLTQGAIAACDRISISDYTEDPSLFDAWSTHLAGTPVELIRRQHDAWDDMTTPVQLSSEQAQRAFDTCWYRRHCVTLERGRLFLCSRIPKIRHDDEGLLLRPALTQNEVLAYLQRPDAPRSCSTCTPMAGLPSVRAGMQPDDRLTRLRTRALTWFAAQEVR